jgi:uncharacterized membrane protein YhaH (DUF805 family)
VPKRPHLIDRKGIGATVVADHLIDATTSMQPLISAFVSAWQRAFDYSGRSRRPDYWWFVLANLIVALVLLLLNSAASFFGWIYSIYTVASIVPSLPLSIRRLRDAGKPWPWIFISLIPIIGGIWLIYLLCQPSVLV